MGWIEAIGALFKAIAAALGMIERERERGVGAALQRGEDEHKELDRIARAAEAGADPHLADADGMRADPFNRDNIR